MKNSLVLIMLAIALVSCVSKEGLKKMIDENPEIVFDTIKNHPAKFMKTLQEAAESAKEDEQKNQFDESFKNPLSPSLAADRIFRGSANAPIKIVEYSDFECPYCTRGYNTVMELLKKYEGKVTFYYKHLPLSFHKNAMMAAQYFEAAALQDKDKAWKLHDEIFAGQRKLGANGEAFVKKLAKEAGLDMGKLAKDVKSDKVKQIIEADLAEASKFGISGTPGFVVNGIPVKGAYPVSHFEMIIEKLKETGKISL